MFLCVRVRLFADALAAAAAWEKAALNLVTY